MLPLDTPVSELVLAVEHPLLAKRPRATVYRWLQEGLIESLKIGGLFYTTNQAVNDFIISCNAKPIRMPKNGPTQAMRKAQIEKALADFDKA